MNPDQEKIFRNAELDYQAGKLEESSKDSRDSTIANAIPAAVLGAVGNYAMHMHNDVLLGSGIVLEFGAVTFGCITAASGYSYLKDVIAARKLRKMIDG